MKLFKASKFFLLALSSILMLLSLNVILSVIIIVITICAYKFTRYTNNAYYETTNHSYFSVRHDKGRHLEYLTYKSLRHFENMGGKFLFNLHIPKGNGGTTEIDVLLICAKGIFVFECKNFSGWIFGNEAQKQWTQTLPIGRGCCHKEHFYNPIMQNSSHIRHLKNLVGRNLPIWSIIVFADRCVFKNVTISSPNISVIKHHRVAPTVSKICDATHVVYTEAQINDIYANLYPYLSSSIC